jgi:hypothetical protein
VGKRGWGGGCEGREGGRERRVRSLETKRLKRVERGTADKGLHTQGLDCTPRRRRDTYDVSEVEDGAFIQGYQGGEDEAAR